MDLHAHLDNSSLDKVLPLGRERHVHFGIVEHAGTRENKYPVVLSTDAELLAYIKMLDGRGVYKGVQAEWNDWMACFSPEVLAQLDYVLTDAMTFPGSNGQRIKLWEKTAADHVDMRNHDHFMDRFVDWHVQIMSTEPFDILANASWLPDALINEYETLWTDRRIQKVVDAAIKYGIAIEIMRQLQASPPGVLETGAGRRGEVQLRFQRTLSQHGKARLQRRNGPALGLKAKDLFFPGDPAKKAVVRRKV